MEEHMAEGKKAGKTKTGVTHFPLQEEDENQKRVPPRGQAKKQRPATPGTGKPRDRASTSATSEGEERTIARRGTKGGKSSGSRAGLVSAGKKARRK